MGFSAFCICLLNNYVYQIENLKILMIEFVLFSGFKNKNCLLLNLYLLLKFVMMFPSGCFHSFSRERGSNFVIENNLPFCCPCPPLRKDMPTPVKSLMKNVPAI